MTREMGLVKGKLRFSESQVRQIEIMPNILHVSEHSLAYQSAFKIVAVKTWVMHLKSDN